MRLVVTLEDEPDAVWRYLFDEATPPTHLQEHLLLWAAEDGGHVYAEVAPDASEETVLQVLDWLSDTAEAVDGQHAEYRSRLERAAETVARWVNGQLT